MFPWNIAKSAEAMFSRWAIKRLCKFYLKRKLGKFILGEVDLDQLDIQLRNGTIRLSDLAINVDFINQKLGSAAAVTVKEGSIGSLLVSLPRKGKGCEIEVDELELVLSPFGGNNASDGSEAFCSSEDANDSISQEPGKIGQKVADSTVISGSMDVHEGVKTIAKIVKWLLTGFHVKVKKLIVAFDPSSMEEKHIGVCRTLVLRITEAECGTCISEEGNSNGDMSPDDFLGLSRLTNFIKFQGAILEFLQMDGVDNHTIHPSASGTTSDPFFSGGCPSNVMTPIVTGEGGGFSGTLKLSIPWKNGSLDIRKVDADAHIDPLELKFQPSSIKWFLHLWEIIKPVGKNNDDQESVYYNASSYCHSATFGSSVIATDEVPGNHGYSADVFSPTLKETLSESILHGSDVISDYVPFCLGRNQQNVLEEVGDFGASVNQFFECFGGMRNSQSASGEGGMLNWTSSVFSAITAASNLATGSLYVPSEQQHVETKFKASVAGISVLFSFLDDDQKNLNDQRVDQMKFDSNVHYLGAKCQGLSFVLQVCPRDVNFEAAVEHVELVDHFSNGCDIMGIGNADIERETVSIQQMQLEVQSSLPPLSSAAEKTELEKSGRSIVTGYPSTMFIVDRNCPRTNTENIYRHDVVKVMLLRTSGVTKLRFTTNSNSSADNVKGQASFSLKLPPFVFWVNIHLISMVLNFVKELGKSSEIDSTSKGSASRSFSDEHIASHGVVTSDFCSNDMISSPHGSLRGDLFLLNARVILCFPNDRSDDLRSYSSWDQFIALDFSSSSNLSEESCQDAGLRTDARSHNAYSSTSTRALHLNVGNIDMFLISSISENSASQKLNFVSQNILSINGGTCRLSRVCLLWQRSPVTGPWIAKKAKLLATSEDSRSRNKFMGKGYEFASVNTVKDTEDFNTCTRQEITMSSSFLLHVHLPPVIVSLGDFQYRALHHLLHQMIDVLSCVPCDPIVVREESSVSQTSIVVECDFIEISVSMEMSETVKGSIQSELPGTWDGLKLRIGKFEFLSVSNIGGILGASFLWVAHGEGKLWGCVTGVPKEELLLISCSNSTVGRGDGEGSNVLSVRSAGTDIINLWDPKNFHSYTSITVRCCTIIALGGRLDWLDAISSFFSSPYLESEQAGENSLKEDNSEERAQNGSSFVLSLVDIGLSYEPYLKKLVVNEALDSNYSSPYVNDEMDEKYVACLLAASSLKIRNIVGVGSMDREYRIRLQDLGLLLRPVSASEAGGGGTDSVEHLQTTGYVKVAREALVEAVLKIFTKNEPYWELDCSKSHIFLETCHDSTLGLIRLAAQLQQIYAPDMEESFAYLQTRWNNVQEGQESNGTKIFNADSTLAASQVHTANLDMKSEPTFTNLMDMICEDAFHLGGKSEGQPDPCDTQLHISLDDGLLREPINKRIKDSRTLSCDLSGYASVPVIGLEDLQTLVPEKSFPQFIDGYFLSELNTLSELSLNNQSSNQILQCKPMNIGNQNFGRGDGWYADSSLRIMENHVMEVEKQTDRLQPLEAKKPIKSLTPETYVKPRGCVLLKNINVMWRLYAGSDWCGFQRNVEHSSRTCGRDTTLCLELALSGMDVQYDIFPDGGICASRLSLSVQDFHLNDNSNDAPWKLVLGYYQSKDHPRRSFSKALKLDLEAVRPDPSTPLEEYRLRIAVLPMRLHLHQCQLDFLISFFGGGCSPVDQSPEPQDSGELLMRSKSSNFGGLTINEEAFLPYFQKFDIWPVLVRVDYSPSRVDLAALRGGKYVELVNLVPWKGVELRLKHVHAIGVYGWSSVCETIIGEWLEDISQNQIHKLLQGLPPIRSLVAVGSGAAKLVSLPMKSYKEDQRLLKGMQRGTISFLRSISLEAIGLGVHLAAGAHEILLQAECILSRSPPSVPLPIQSRNESNVKSNQPKDVRQGMQQAYESIGDGLGKSAAALVQTPLKRYQRGAGAGSALATAIKAAPAAAVAPASAVARAVHCALLGARNSLDLEHKQESIEKYTGLNEKYSDLNEKYMGPTQTTREFS